MGILCHGQCKIMNSFKAFGPRKRKGSKQGTHQRSLSGLHTPRLYTNGPVMDPKMLDPGWSSGNLQNIGDACR